MIPMKEHRRTFSDYIELKFRGWWRIPQKAVFSVYNLDSDKMFLVSKEGALTI